MSSNWDSAGLDSTGDRIGGRPQRLPTPAVTLPCRERWSASHNRYVSDMTGDDMDYSAFVKRLHIRSGEPPPRELIFGAVRAVALTREHLDDDVQGINASIDLIRRTRGGSWPSGPVTHDFNYVDLVWHECEFREGDSFSYALYNENDGYLGCFYLYPLGRRGPLTEDLLGYDVDASWWVTPDAYARGYYAMAYQAIRHWTAAQFPDRCSKRWLKWTSQCWFD